jgi:16S rRNA (cytosine1402-N4)-methyltransferase
MVTEVTEFLGDRGTVVDMTLGAGGHALALLSSGVDQVIGIDRDPAAIAFASGRLASFGSRFRAVETTFSGADHDLTGGAVDGILYDLGVSSMQLDTPERGFGYRVDGPLDMRMSSDGTSAADLVNGLSEPELADLIYEYGGEHRSRRIARAIVRKRPITTTDQLAGVIAGALGKRPGGPHPARRTFQALRIAVNREIDELAASLPRAAELLAPGGRVVVIAYHSLEDRISKRCFRESEQVVALTKKPLRATEAEVAANPRARSAMLRAAERVEVAA